ncbi:MAG: type II toxin-antitoxin system VapC family toxin [Candidatus Sericytochromatia bacterium]|nr:type II toxin-antitoxin system VapC family toxin [Candidatus Tanganyikabacteria bacterium]
MSSKPIDTYLESSAVLRALLEGDADLERLLEQAVPLTASRLTWFEADRALRQAVSAGRKTAEEAAAIRDQLEAVRSACHTIDIDEEALACGARDFPREPVYSLDAIHLGTALYLRDALGVTVFASCDTRLRENAGDLGFALLPPAGRQVFTE